MARLQPKYRAFENTSVAEIFKAYPDKVRPKLLFLRQLIFDAASATEGVGDLEETLRWGEPSYLTTQSGSGSMVRINSKGSQGQYAMYFHCQTNLIATFRTMYSDVFAFEGNRAITFGDGDLVPVEELRHCISLALTYHRDKRRPKAGKPKHVGRMRHEP